MIVFLKEVHITSYLLKYDPENLVTDFIEQFKFCEKDNVLVKTFTQGFCYYFAVILNERFKGTILYEPIIGHFVIEIDKRFYDITGDVTNKYSREIMYNEKQWSKQKSILTGCIYKTDRYNDK